MDGEAMYTKEQMLATLRKYWPMGDEALYGRYLATLTPEPDKGLVELLEFEVRSNMGVVQDAVDQVCRRNLVKALAQLLTSRFAPRDSGLPELPTAQAVSKWMLEHNLGGWGSDDIHPVLRGVAGVMGLPEPPERE